MEAVFQRYRGAVDSDTDVVGDEEQLRSETAQNGRPRKS
ncbi:unnamed protein product [Acidithrix sp. C25]|nr:unnamed protein product [Acidithrix sp. C25]